MGSHPGQSENTNEDIASKKRTTWKRACGLAQQLTGADLGFTPMIKVDEPWTVEKVIKEVPGDAPTEGSSSPLAFFHILERLKTTKREGWRRFGIDRYDDRLPERCDSHTT